jgi:hypothetical protein
MHIPSELVIAHLARFAPREAARLARASQRLWRDCGRFAKGWMTDADLYKLLVAVDPDVWVRVDRHPVTDAMERVYVTSNRTAAQHVLERSLPPDVKSRVCEVVFAARMVPPYEPPPSAPMDRAVIALVERYSAHVMIYLTPQGTTDFYDIDPASAALELELKALGVRFAMWG